MHSALSYCVNAICEIGEEGLRFAHEPDVANYPTCNMAGEQ